MYFTVTNLIICIYSQKTEPTNSAPLQACGVYITIFILLKERKEGRKEKGKKKKPGWGEKIDPAKIINHNHEGYLCKAMNIHLRVNGDSTHLPK